MEGTIQVPFDISTEEFARLVFEALKKSTYGGTKTGESRPGDHKEE